MSVQFQYDGLVQTINNLHWNGVLSDVEREVLLHQALELRVESDIAASAHNEAIRRETLLAAADAYGPEGTDATDWLRERAEAAS